MAAKESFTKLITGHEYRFNALCSRTGFHSDIEMYKKTMAEADFEKKYSSKRMLIRLFTYKSFTQMVCKSVLPT